MPKLAKLEAMRCERRKAEQDIVAMKARLRLLRDTAEHNEKKAKRNKELKAKIETIKTDAEWVAEEVENEFVRRDMQNMEKRMLTIEQKQQDAAYLAQSKKLVSQTRAENAQKQRDDLAYRLEAAYGQQQAEWEKRRNLAEAGRKRAAWYKSVSSLAAREFESRISEMKQMGVAEEETRRYMVKEDREQFLDALAIEEQRLKEARELCVQASKELKLYAAGKEVPASSGKLEDARRPQSGPSGNGGLWGHGLSASSSGRSLVPSTSYQISGPGMATVTRQKVPGHASMHRVHFPFAVKDQTNFAFEPPVPLRHQPGVQPGTVKGGVFRRGPATSMAVRTGRF